MSKVTKTENSSDSSDSSLLTSSTLEIKETNKTIEEIKSSKQKQRENKHKFHLHLKELKNNYQIEFLNIKTIFNIVDINKIIELFKKDIEVKNEFLKFSFENNKRDLYYKKENDIVNLNRKLSTSIFEIKDQSTIDNYKKEIEVKITTIEEVYIEDLKQITEQFESEIEKNNLNLINKVNDFNKDNLTKDEIQNELNDQLKELKHNYKLQVNEEKQRYHDLYVKGISLNSKGKVVEVRNLYKYYKNGSEIIEVIKGINFDINESELVVILGPSGSGKTTILNIVSGLDVADSGDIIVANHNLLYLNDRELTKFRANNISFIFQQYNLLPTLTVLENIKTGHELQKDKDKQLNLFQLIKDLKLDNRAKLYPYQLSGGQQQRVAIGRALAKNPKILFADEPTGALDENTSRQVLELLIDINKKYLTTIIIVTHDSQIALLANKVIKFHDGKIEGIYLNKKPSMPSELRWEA